MASHGLSIRWFRPVQQEQIRPTNTGGVPRCTCGAEAKELTVKKGLRSRLLDQVKYESAFV